MYFVYFHFKNLVLNTGPIWFGLVWLVVRGGDGDNLRREGEIAKLNNHPPSFRRGRVTGSEGIKSNHFGAWGRLRHFYFV